MIVALVMLLLLTIIGTASIRDTSLQEKMAANLRDYNLAFQAAEAGLREGERVAFSSYSTLGALADNASTEEATFTSFPGEVHTKPKYTITKLPHPGQLDLQDMVNPQLAGGGSLAAGEAMILDFILVRVESTGTGMSADSKVKLRSVYFVEE